ncbi:hypothetical protein EV426DRAFT_572428 [Tirmania nivea]|nr:hypothetical protein EV426DRAFT_572428 [Tirmania nivea]
MDQIPYYATGSNILPLASPRTTFSSSAPPSISASMSVPVDEQMTIEFSTPKQPMQISTSSEMSMPGPELMSMPGLELMSMNVSIAQHQSRPSNSPIDPLRLPLIFPEGRPTETRRRLGENQKRRKRVEARQMKSLLKGLDKVLRIDDTAPTLSATKIQGVAHTRSKKMKTTAAAAAAVEKEKTHEGTVGKERRVRKKETHNGRIGKGRMRGLPISQNVATELRKQVEEAQAAGAVMTALEIPMEEGKVLSRRQAQRLRKKIRIAVGKVTGGVKGDRAGKGEAGQNGVGQDGKGKEEAGGVVHEEIHEKETDMMDLI